MNAYLTLIENCGMYYVVQVKVVNGEKQYLFLKTFYNLLEAEEYGRSQPL
jgi:hypothetical protein